MAQEIEVREDGSLPALPDDIRGVGLEDFDETDLITPRLSILHQLGVFEHPQTNQQWDSFECILLGMVKQRTLWKPVLEEKGKPLCRSYDFKVGHPGENFPLDESGFTGEEGDELPCADCELKEWGSHPNTNAPWCNEQHVYPMLILDEEVGYLPVILTLSKTGIKPSRSYLNPFMNNQRPLFTAVTRLSLDKNRKGGNIYSVPVFERVGPSDKDEWQNWAAQFRRIKAFLNTPRGNPDDSTETKVEEPQAAKPKRAKKATKSVDTTAVAEDESDLWDEDNVD